MVMSHLRGGSHCDCGCDCGCGLSLASCSRMETNIPIFSFLIWEEWINLDEQLSQRSFKGGKLTRNLK